MTASLPTAEFLGWLKKTSAERITKIQSQDFPEVFSSNDMIVSPGLAFSS